MRLLACAGIYAALVLGASAAPARAALDFDPCPGTPDFECAMLDVPADPGGAQPGSMRLAVRRAVDTRDAPDVLVALGGGPGQSATRFLDDFSDVLAEAVENRQLVVLDQRGTGDSGALRCAALDSGGQALAAAALTARVQRCGQEVGDARRLYTTTQVVEDLEALRRALGVPRLSLFGISYGAYVAQRYARRYPEAVDRLLLDSPVAQDQGGAFDKTSYGAVATLLRGVCARGRCRGVTADPVADLRRLAARLRSVPLRGRVYDARGRAHTIVLRDQGQLFDLFVSSDFSPPLRAALPGGVSSALRGDASPLLRLLAIDAGIGDPHDYDEDNEDPAEFSNALYFVTTCEEKPLPWRSAAAPLAGRAAVRTAALRALGRGAFAPFGRSAAESTQVGTAFCERWPPTPVAAPPPPGPITAPTLILSGALDVRTPTAEAAATARWIPDASLVRVPDAGHSVVSSRLPCVSEAMIRFFAGDAVGNPCAGRSAADVPGVAPRAPTAPRLRGRDAAPAVVATIADAARALAEHGLLDAPIGFGGLRGGRACALPGELDATDHRAAELELRRYSYMRGLTVSGRARVSHGRLIGLAATVSGASSVRGRLALRRGRLVGRLGGRRVRMATGDVRIPRLLVAPSPVSRSRRCR